MNNFVDTVKIKLKKKTPEELSEKICELVTDNIIKDKEIERLNKRVKECEEAYLRTRHQYSELEGKYVIDEYVINELEEFIEKEIELYTVELTEENKNKLSIVAPIKGVYKEIYNVLQELKGDSSNE